MTVILWNIFAKKKAETDMSAFISGLAVFPLTEGGSKV